MLHTLRQDTAHDNVLACTNARITVTAPPGTGKTFLSVRLAGDFLASHPGTRALLLTFSNQARTQIEKEADRRLSQELRARVEITNYHRFFWSLVRSYRRVLGLPDCVDIWSSNWREGAFRAHLDPAELATIAAHQGLMESMAEQAFPEFQDDRTPEPQLLLKALSVVSSEHRAGRLIFDDLGALCWRLLTEHIPIVQGLQCRFSLVVADEHQDASELQDRIVRLLGQEGRLAIFGDQMQLIHEFRGAREHRLQRHLDECRGAGAVFSLATPHRWRSTPKLGEWLLAVRSRLSGTTAEHQTPKEVKLKHYDASKGTGFLKAQIKYAVMNAFAIGGEIRTVAVLGRANDSVADLRGYLCKEGLFPKQLGGTDFEEAREEIESLREPLRKEELVKRGLARLQGLLPSLPPQSVSQARGRVHSSGLNTERASEFVKDLLLAFNLVYTSGPSHYFVALQKALEHCERAGHACPRDGAVYSLRSAVASCPNPASLQEAASAYSTAVLRQCHCAPQTKRGLFLMTAHQAKGKEFDAVILSDFSQRYWPDNLDTRRLLYVALTRAGQRLSIFVPDRGVSALRALL